MAWYIWMEDGRPHLGYGHGMEEAKKNDVTKEKEFYHSTFQDSEIGEQRGPFSSAEEKWLKSEIEKLEQERRNLKIPPDSAL